MEEFEDREIYIHFFHTSMFFGHKKVTEGILIAFWNMIIYTFFIY